MKQQADAEEAQVKSEKRAAQIQEERGAILAEFPDWAADEEEQNLLWHHLASQEPAESPTMIHHMEIVETSPQEVHVAEDREDPDF